jgi:hypothetical protein
MAPAPPVSASHAAAVPALPRLRATRPCFNGVPYSGSVPKCRELLLLVCSQAQLATVVHADRPEGEAPPLRSRRSRFALPRRLGVCKSGYCSCPRIIARRCSLQPSPSASRPRLPCFLRQLLIVGQPKPWGQCRGTFARPWPAAAQASSVSVHDSRRPASTLRYCGPTLAVD